MVSSRRTGLRDRAANHLILRQILRRSPKTAITLPNGSSRIFSLRWSSDKCKAGAQQIAQYVEISRVDSRADPKWQSIKLVDECLPIPYHRIMETCCRGCGHNFGKGHSPSYPSIPVIQSVSNTAKPSTDSMCSQQITDLCSLFIGCYSNRFQHMLHPLIPDRVLGRAPSFHIIIDHPARTQQQSLPSLYGIHP